MDDRGEFNLCGSHSPTQVSLHLKSYRLHLHSGTDNGDLVAQASFLAAPCSRFVPVDDPELAYGCVLDLELPILVGHCVIGMFENPHVADHPAMNCTLVLNRLRF